jgi:hypothetical protein
MSKWIVIAGFLCTGLVAACGGGSGSGVSSGKTLVSLSDSEITDFCEYAVDLAGPERTVDCGGGVTITIGGGSVAECVTGMQMTQDQFPGCAATVGQAERCAEDMADLTDAQLCSDGPLPASCQPLLGPGCTGGTAVLPMLR